MFFLIVYCLYIDNILGFRRIDLIFYDFISLNILQKFLDFFGKYYIICSNYIIWK